ncbi:MAG TPA: hypothetical protein VLF93_07710 [Candidatus Saccharimonadales bacterium]|nr:hypothetical protein [Candidatus Saccharimonadales bacterium]
MSLRYPTRIFEYIPALKPRVVKDLIKTIGYNTNRTSLIHPLKENTDKKEKSPETKGLEQHARDKTIKIESDKNKLDELIRKSNRSIISISSVFPWNFFPNTVDVEESRVTFIFRQLFASQSHSVDINDISNVFIESGFFFATLQVVSRTYIQNDIKIEFLKKKDAYRTKDIIEGLRTFIQNDINTSNYETAELVEKLNELNISKATN